MGNETTELAKAGWFLCGVAIGLLLAVMRHEIPEMVRTVMREFRGQAAGDTVQITKLDKE